MLQRQTAYKIQAGDILLGQPIFEGDRFSALEHSGTRVSRVNILGNIIDKYVNEEKKYCTLTLDDGSGQVRLKGFSDQFELLNSPQIGDTVRTIGLLRFYNDELYILPEIIHKVDPRWLHVRRLELGKTGEENKKPAEPVNNSSKQSTNTQTQPLQKQPDFQPIQPTQEKVIEEKVIEEKKEEPKVESIESPKLKALELIRKQKEIEIQTLAILTGILPDALNPIINELITEGEIYELKPGYLCSVN